LTYSVIAKLKHLPSSNKLGYGCCMYDGYNVTSHAGNAADFQTFTRARCLHEVVKTAITD